MFCSPQKAVERQALLSGHPAAAAELAALARRLHGDVAALATAVSIYPLLNIAPKAEDRRVSNRIW